jgi:hypothetical protein
MAEIKDEITISSIGKTGITQSNVTLENLYNINFIRVG